MKRKLLAFGDSHTAGAEIEFQYQSHCYEKSFIAKIANYYTFDYENFAVSGGSNDYLITKFYPRIQEAIDNKESIFVIIGFCEPSRTFYLENDILFHITSKSYIGYPKSVRKFYENYIKKNTNYQLNKKSLECIFNIQEILKQNDIPFIFFVSTYWYYGDWSLIDTKNFYGHHEQKKSNYNKEEIWNLYNQYGFWGTCMTHPDWKHLRKDIRWSRHYPEEFHNFWAKKMINFIDQQNILSENILIDTDKDSTIHND